MLSTEIKSILLRVNSREPRKQFYEIAERKGRWPAVTSGITMAAVAQQEQGSVLLRSLGRAFRDVLLKDVEGEKDE